MVYQTISGPIVTFNSDLSFKIKNLKVTINPVQSGSGDPSPDNVRPISGWSAVNVWVKPTYDSTANPTATIQLDQTIYGGTLDVTNGVLTVTHGFVVIDGTTSIATYSGKRKTFTATGFKAPGASVRADITCNRLRTVTKNASGDANLINASDANTNQIMFNVGISNLDLVSDWLAHNPLQVVYPLATPITIPLTPMQISMLQGENNVWADSGNIALDYLVEVDGKPLLLTPKYANTVSGNIATFSTNITSPLKSCVVTFNPVQSGSGDPSPDNVRPISGWTGCNVQNNSLPAEYQRVEYLESGSDCYILTDYYPSEKTTYKSKGAITSSGWVFGSRTAREYGDSMGWLLTTSNNYKTFRVDYAEQQLSINYTTTTRRFRVESSYKNSTWSYVAYTGDTDSIFEQGSVSERTFTGAYPLVLFGLNNGGAISKYAGVKLFYLTLMEDEQITADFVPCYRKSDNTPGMYDIIGRKFYTNSGTGGFAVGPDISSGTTIPISWETEAGTVYGGTLNLLTGVLSVTFISTWIINLTGLTYNLSGGYFQTDIYPSAKKGINSVVSNNLCSCYKTLAPNNIQDLSFNISTDGRFIFRDDRFGGVKKEFQLAVGYETIVYELETPVTYQLTPQQISTLNGVNNIWADCGPVLVTYDKASMFFIS